MSPEWVTLLFERFGPAGLMAGAAIYLAWSARRIAVSVEKHLELVRNDLKHHQEHDDTTLDGLIESISGIRRAIEEITESAKEERRDAKEARSRIYSALDEQGQRLARMEGKIGG